MNYMCYLVIRDIFLVIGHHNLAIQWNLSNPTHQGTREMGEVVGCRNTQVLFQLTKIPWDHTFLLDVSGCWKTQVSDCTSSTVF